MRLRDPMPEFDGATDWLNSRGAKRRDLIEGNKPALIHFWSISCDLCKESMPQINELRDQLKNDLHVIAVHMPRSKKDMDLDAIKEAAKGFKITQPIFIDNAHKLTNAFNVKYVPAYYVFDADGKLRHSQSGGGGMTMLRKRLSRVLDN
ncbi:thiol-disulfide oxidoreductase [Virgibacillus indicus]|uniref:Thiol-disulfide oxidoreductase n=1 Tax=Virgibacillus indicus TaxID=2024554 RepID=A0A265NGY3_9BACI|nr:TlpA disulfide reductase family protein [Virgibacillus indicus]OZU90684.1 thiol-disulfide oxidoreductase [Virgibacillus indicus]